MRFFFKPTNMNIFLLHSEHTQVNTRTHKNLELIAVVCLMYSLVNTGSYTVATFI